MPARDIYHDTLKAALIKDGWTITHDPLMMRLARKKLYIDLGAQRLIAAQRDTERITNPFLKKKQVKSYCKMV